MLLNAMKASGRPTQSTLLLGRRGWRRRFGHLPDLIVPRNFKKRTCRTCSIELGYLVGGNSEPWIGLLRSQNDLQLRGQPSFPANLDRPFIAHRLGWNCRRLASALGRHSSNGLLS